MELKNTVTKINKLNRIMEGTEERIIELGNKQYKLTNLNKIKSVKKSKQSLRNLWNKNKRSKIYVTEIQEERRKEGKV